MTERRRTNNTSSDLTPEPLSVALQEQILLPYSDPNEARGLEAESFARSADGFSYREGSCAHVPCLFLSQMALDSTTSI